MYFRWLCRVVGVVVLAACGNTIAALPDVLGAEAGSMALSPPGGSIRHESSVRDCDTFSASGVLCPSVPGAPVSITLQTPNGAIDFDHVWMTRVVGFTRSFALTFTQESEFKSADRPRLAIRGVISADGTDVSARVETKTGSVDVPIDFTVTSGSGEGDVPFAGTFSINSVSPTFAASGVFSVAETCCVAVDK